MSAGQAGTGPHGLLSAITAGAKISHLAGAYVRPLAADPVAIDGWLAAQPGRLGILLLATVSFPAPPALLAWPIAPAQMGTPGWLSTPRP